MTYVLPKGLVGFLKSVDDSKKGSLKIKGVSKTLTSFQLESGISMEVSTKDLVPYKPKVGDTVLFSTVTGEFDSAVPEKVNMATKAKKLMAGTGSMVIKSQRV